VSFAPEERSHLLLSRTSRIIELSSRAKRGICFFCPRDATADPARQNTAFVMTTQQTSSGDRR
jgi:hypothetical protein